MFQNLQVELSQKLKRQRDRSHSVDSGRDEGRGESSHVVTTITSASMDRRHVLVNGGSRGGGSDVLMDLMAAPSSSIGRSGRSPARSRTEEVAEKQGPTRKSRHSGSQQGGEGSAAQEKRLTSALDNNLNELLVSPSPLDTARPGNRARTKSESRGEDRDSEKGLVPPTENGERDSTTALEMEDTSRVLNLLKDPRRRPIEVDAREFRVLAEQLLLGDGSSGNRPHHLKQNHTDISPGSHQHQLVNGGRSSSGRRKPNGYVTSKSRSRSSDRVFDADTTTALSSKSRQKVSSVGGAGFLISCDEVDGPGPAGPPKPGRRSRRENFELETMQATNTASHPQQATGKKASTSSGTAVAAVGSSSREKQQREVGNSQTEYTTDEKEWLKEKLLEEFERQELLNKKSVTSSSSSGQARKKQHHKVDLPASSSPPAHHHHNHHHVATAEAGGQPAAVLRAEEIGDKGHQLAGRPGSLCRDTIAEMTSGLVEHYFLRAIPAQPSGGAAKLPAMAAVTTSVAAAVGVAASKGVSSNNCDGGGSHHRHHQTTTATSARRKDCCGAVSSGTIDEVVTKAAVATTTTVFLSEQHRNSSGKSCESGGGGSNGGGRHNGPLDHLCSAAYWTSLTQLEGASPDTPPAAARLSMTMPRDKMVLLPAEKASPSLHASLPRPAAGRRSHTESWRESSLSMPGSPPPYVHPKSEEKDCSCPCDCRSSLYPSQEVRGLLLCTLYIVLLLHYCNC